MVLDCNEILPDRLWVGAYIRPEDVQQLTRMGITTVVSLQTDEDLADRRVSLKRLVEALDKAGIELRRAPTRDFDKSDLLRNLRASVSELEQALAPAWTRVYLHCTAGINRSPTVAAAYLMKSRGMTARQALEYVDSRRYCSPYMDVLEQFEESLGTDAPRQ